MKIPRKGTRRHQILMNFVEAGQMNATEFEQKYGLLGLGSRASLCGELSGLRLAGLLLRSGDSYISNVDIELPYLEKPNVVEPRTVKPFEEINSKYLLPKVSPRGQEIREISFIGLGASIATPNYY